MRRLIVGMSFAVLFAVPLFQARAGDGDVKQQITNLKSKSPETRCAAADALGKLGPKAPATAIDALVLTLGDEDVAVRKAAGSALLEIGEPSIPAVAKSITSFNRAAQLMALTVLARFGPDAKSSVEEVVEALKDPDLEVRIHATKALQAIGPAAKAALPALIDGGSDLSSVGEELRPGLPSSVCEGALQAIYAIDPGALTQAAKAALPALLKGFKSDDRGTRLAVTNAVGLLGHHGNAAVADLALMAIQEKGILKSAAFGSLQDLGTEGHKILWALARDEKMPFQQRAAIIRSFWWRSSDASKVTVDALSKFLKHKDPAFRRLAADVLGSFGPAAKAAIPDLIASLTDDDLLGEADPFDKTTPELYASARALARIGDAALPALIEALGSDNSVIRWQATKALSYMGRKAKKAIPNLRQGLNDKATLVKMETTCALLRAGDTPTEPLQLLEKQLQFANSDGRWAALEIIARVGPRAKSLTPKVLALVADKDLAHAALFTLQRIGPGAKDAVPTAAKVLESGDPSLRVLSLELLYALGSDAKPAVPALIAGLQDMDQEYRVAVANVLSQIGPDAKDAVPAMIDGIKSPDAFQLRALIYALGAIGPDAKAAVPQLVMHLKHPNPKVRADAARTLGDIGPAAKEALPAIRELLKDDDRSVRTWAVYALAAITEDFNPNVTALMTIYKTKVLDPADEPSRYAAILALARIGPAAKKAIPVFVEVAKGPLPQLAKQAILAFGQFGADSKEAVPLLIEMLRNENAELREAAAQSLGGIGPAAKAAVPRLTEMVNVDDEVVADAAAEALRSIQAKK